jgi:hybrid cluster-associated redox disulfide protein
MRFPTPQTLVSDVMDAWPATVPVFLGRGMACPGCPMAPFMTVGEAAAAYGLDAGEFAGALAAAAKGVVPEGTAAPPRPHPTHHPRHRGAAA